MAFDVWAAAAMRQRRPAIPEKASGGCHGCGIGCRRCGRNGDRGDWAVGRSLQIGWL